MALAAGKKERSGASVRAVEPKLFAENASFKNLFEVKSGVLAFESERSAVIGSALAEKTGLAVGDTLHLITMRNLPNGKVVPKTAAFTVSGIVSSGYQELDALWVFVPLEAGFEWGADMTHVKKLEAKATVDSKYSIEKTTVGEILDTPKLRAIVEKIFPQVLNHPLLETGRTFKFIDAIPYMKDMIKPEDLENFSDALEEIE